MLLSELIQILKNEPPRNDCMSVQGLTSHLEELKDQVHPELQSPILLHLMISHQDPNLGVYKDIENFFLDMVKRNKAGEYKTGLKTIYNLCVDVFETYYRLVRENKTIVTEEGILDIDYNAILAKHNISPSGAPSNADFVEE